MDWEHSIIQMEANMKENGKIITNMVREYLHSKMALNILDHLIKIEWLKERFLLKIFSIQYQQSKLIKKMKEKVKPIKVKLIQKLLNLKEKVSLQVQLRNLHQKLH